MASSFAIHPARFSSLTDSAFRDEIRAHTGCDEQAASILRSIARLGDDPSIWRYEMTPVMQRIQMRVPRIAWSVRAVRP